ncbi:MAG: ABC transporter ATP-binding protein, partial [Oscillospiraceae bacterium]|nr:ABC transporter ATP-binding protein [Oscillospiraceae bacterium]
MLCALLASAVDLIFPYVSKNSMQRYLPEQAFRTFFIVMGLMAAAYVLKAVFYYLITLVGHRMGTLIEADMRSDIFRHMQRLSYSFYDKNRTGALMSRITNDLFDITELAHHGP